MTNQRRYLASLLALVVLVAACGTNDAVDPPDLRDGDAPLIQVGSIGGFVPVEFNLNRGPTYTVTNNGRFVFEGPRQAIYPEKAVPGLVEGQLTDDGMETIRDLIEEMGLAEITEEHDDSVTNVADASTEVIKYFDNNGVHQYSVYALGITDRDLAPATAAFSELFDFLNSLSGSVFTEPYDVEQVQIVAGADYQGPDPDSIDIRPWPLEGEDPLEWDELTTVGENQIWTCKSFEPSIIDVFEDATQATLWMDPSEGGDAQNYRLLVRPLHPGEEPCTLN